MIAYKAEIKSLAFCNNFDINGVNYNLINVVEWEQVLTLLGSDLYDLTPEIIQEAFHALETHEVVIGPAKDGGYYLLGMKSIHKQIFQNKNWGTATVLKETLEDLTNKKVFLLEELNDVDVFEDIEFHPAFQQFFD